MRKVEDSQFHVPGRAEGENVSRIASGLQALWQQSPPTSHDGLEAGKRLVQAGFHYRAALMGLRQAALAGTPGAHGLREDLRETDQLLAFAGAKEAITSLRSTLDLTAAGLYRLYFGPPHPDAARETDLEAFPKDAKLERPLPPACRDWLATTRGDNTVNDLNIARDLFTHRHFQMHITISLGSAAPSLGQKIDLGPRQMTLSDLIDEARTFVLDRIVSLSLIYE